MAIIKVYAPWDNGVMKKLNLGCGTNIRKGWINLDSKSLSGVDIVHDMEQLPLPFYDEEFDYILCQNILEHLDYIPILRDIYRILKMGGILEIRVPHFTSRSNFIDPTHKKLFSVQTFQFFIENSYDHRNYYFDFHFSKIQDSRINFLKGVLFYNYLVEPLVNISEKTQILFEATFLSRIFPGDVIELKMIK